MEEVCFLSFSLGFGARFDSVLICNVNFCFKIFFLQDLPSLLLNLICNSIMLINSPLTNSLEIDMTLIYQLEQRGSL